jgi:AraC family cel operon transcriptional repressor
MLNYNNLAFCEIKKHAEELHTSIILSANPFGGADAYLQCLNTEYAFLHDHNHWELCIIVNGSICHHVNGKIIKQYKGDVTLIRPTDKHMLIFDKNDRPENYLMINLPFTESFAQKLFGVFNENIYDLVKKVSVPLTAKLNELHLAEIVNTSLSIQHDDSLSVDDKVFYCKSIIVEHVGSLIKEYCSCRENLPVWLKDFLMFISSPESFNLCSSDLAGYASYSYTRLSHLFKSYMGIPLVQYRNQIKLNHSTNLLTYTDRSIIDIAMSLGFNNLSHFNHLFKRTFGISPREYRKQKITTKNY